MSVNQFDPHAVLVAPLSHFGRHDVMLAGGKGANLGELSRAGFDVPPGYVITTAAYDLLLQENDLQAPLASVLVSLNLDHPDSVKNVSQQIDKVLQESSIPLQIVDEVLKAY